MYMLILKFFLLQLTDVTINCATEAIIYGVPKDKNDITQDSIKRLNEYIKEQRG